MTAKETSTLLHKTVYERIGWSTLATLYNYKGFLYNYRGFLHNYKGCGCFLDVFFDYCHFLGLKTNILYIKIIFYSEEDNYFLNFEQNTFICTLFK